MLKGCKLIIALFSMLLIACSSSSSKYDGFRGYKINNKDQQSVSITYIDESRDDNNEIIEKAKKSCADLFDDGKLSNVEFDIVNTKKYKKDVYFNVALPSVNVGSSSVNNPGSGLVMSGPSTSYNSEKILRAISFFEVSIKCSIK